MVKKLLELLKRRTYSTSEDRKEFNTDSRKRLEKKVREKISNEMKANLQMHEFERNQRIELEVLVDVLKENPDYYSESEISKLYFDIVKT